MIRNIAIIAHVDHGKTTLVDELLKQSGIFKSHEQVDERVMDSGDLEKERGITILSKNTSVFYKGDKINIVDTPGHADFGGEVERVLGMVDGVLLVVDAFEGPMPQTRFVLSKALMQDLQPIVVINKVDRPGAEPFNVADRVLDLFIELEASDKQLDFPVVFASAKKGVASLTSDEEGTDLSPLFETIVANIHPKERDSEGPFRMLVSNIEGDEYLGRIALGRVDRGVPHVGDSIVIVSEDGKRNGKIGKIFTYSGLKKESIEEGETGDIVAIAGLGDINIGETLCDAEHVEPIPFTCIDAPTVSMTFSVNDGPFAGLEGEFVTSRQIRDRLYKEMETNLSLKVEDTDRAESFLVSGRGELHLSILIETMRREGYEFLVSKPVVIYKEEHGEVLEPIEHLIIDVPEEFMGTVMEKVGFRKAELINMSTGNRGYTRLEFKIPAKNLIGYRSEFLTDTRGNGILNHSFLGYEPLKGKPVRRPRGSLVAFERGTTSDYGLFNAQERGTLFVDSGVDVYEGMIVGENARGEDIEINVCKQKHLTNMRASGSDESLKLSPKKELSLEQAIEFIEDDELVEITPQNIRLRKKILDSGKRAKANRRSQR